MSGPFQSESGLAKPELYVIVDGMPTKKFCRHRQSRSSSIGFMAIVKPDDVEKSTEDLVTEVANSASSTMLEKVND